MAEHQELRVSKKSKSLFGKLHRKGKMRYQQAVLDDEEHLMCDDKHETNNDYTVKMQSNDKAEDACVTRKHQNGNERPVKEGSTLETGIREAILEPNSADRPTAYHSGKQLTDINLFESDIISAPGIPENTCVVKVNAIIESSRPNDNNSQRYLEESEAGFLVTANELYKSDSSLLQNEKSIITSHFDNLFVSHAGTSVVTEEVLEARTNAVDKEAGDRSNLARISRAKENAVEVDNVEDSPMSESTPCISAPTNSKRHGKENRRKKRKAKTMRKSNRNSKTSEATSDEETAFYVHSSGGSDPETIEILTIDTEMKKEKKKKRRKKAKRIVAKAGLTMWKGIRTGWKLMWDGLSMYTLPLGTLDVTTNITKFWSANNSSSARA